MNLKNLKIFCDVVGWRSFSRAANENGISQSGASQLVHQLEDRLGVKLIDRSKRPFVLTPEGDMYYAGCRKLVQTYESLEEEIRTMNQELSGRVGVASIYSVGLHHMNRYMQEFLTQFPKANVRLEYQHPVRVAEMVADDQVDIGLISYPKSTRSLKATLWREEPMVLVCAPSHPFASQKTVAIQQLHQQLFISFDDNLQIRREVDRILQSHHAIAKIAMQFDNIETIKRAVEINAGVAILPEPTILNEAVAGSLVTVPLVTSGEKFIRPVGIIQRRGRELCKTARCFFDLLMEKNNVSQHINQLVATNGNSTKSTKGSSNGNGSSNGQAKANP